jgi:GntR family transcriptional regulator
VAGRLQHLEESADAAVRVLNVAVLLRPHKVYHKLLYHILTKRLKLAQLVESSSVPMYRQLEALLREGIERGELQVGDRIPSEAQLCDRWGISRITTRQALAELERDGLLERVPGKGTFVKKPQGRVTRLTRLSGFGENMEALGLKPGYETLKADREPVPLEVAGRLQSAGGEAFVIERILFADGERIGSHTSYLPSWIIGQAPEGSFTRDALNRGSLYQAIENAGVSLLGADEIVEPDTAGEVEASRLGVREGDLVLRVKRTVYDSEWRPVEYVVLTYRADRYTYRIRLQR